jgi:lambda family phage portal protein
MAIQTLFNSPAPQASGFIQLFPDGIPALAPAILAPVAPIKASASGYPAYQGANLTRLNADWIGSLLSSDQEIRTSLKRLRARCRQLHNNNEYAQRFVNLVKQNVIGPNGINLEAQISLNADTLNDAVNEEIEHGWRAWSRIGNATCDRRLNFRDACMVALETLIVDGEYFVRKVKGFRNNPFRYTLQFIDPDQVDASFNQARHFAPTGEVTNEIRMGIEVDEWLAPVAYWVYDGHPSEGHVKRTRIPASEIEHGFIFRRGNQTRGVPWLVAAMSRMNMLGGYDEAELVAARLGACKMAVVETPTGDGYTGVRDPDSGAVVESMEPGTTIQLQAGEKMTAFDPQHPNSNYPEFVKQMVRAMAVGLNCSYTSLAGDLREVNFSSIRQGVLDERDCWRVLQAFAVDHFCQPIYAGWVPSAIVSGALDVPASGLDDYVDPDNLRWQTRGWTWVDPLKDVSAAIVGRGAGMRTLADICSETGRDWRDNIDQIALENEYAKKKGVELNFDRAKPNSIGAQPEADPDPNAPEVPVKEGEDGGNDQ